MILPGHLAGGYLATHALLFLAPATFSPTEVYALYAIGIIASDSPDIDLLWFYFENKKYEKNQKLNHGEVENGKASKHPKANHREHITHTPIFWLIVSAIIAFIGYIFNSSFTEFGALVILAGSWSHLIFDSIVFGVCWFWPLSKKRYCIFRETGTTNQTQIDHGDFNSYWKYVTGPYLKSPVLYAEILIVIIAVVVFIKSM